MSMTITPITKLTADDRAVWFLSTAIMHAEEARLRRVDVLAVHPSGVDSTSSDIQKKNAHRSPADGRERCAVAPYFAAGVGRPEQEDRLRITSWRMSPGNLDETNQAVCIEIRSGRESYVTARNWVQSPQTVDLDGPAARLLQRSKKAVAGYIECVDFSIGEIADEQRIGKGSKLGRRDRHAPRLIERSIGDELLQQRPALTEHIDIAGTSFWCSMDLGASPLSERHIPIAIEDRHIVRREALRQAGVGETANLIPGIVENLHLVVRKISSKQKLAGCIDRQTRVRRTIRGIVDGNNGVSGIYRRTPTRDHAGDRVENELGITALAVLRNLETNSGGINGPGRRPLRDRDDEAFDLARPLVIERGQARSIVGNPDRPATGLRQAPGIDQIWIDVWRLAGLVGDQRHDLEHRRSRDSTVLRHPGRGKQHETKRENKFLFHQFLPE